MKKIISATVISNVELAENIYDMKIYCPELCMSAKSGQFIEVYLDDGIHLLPRPISICDTYKDIGQMRLIYQVAGEGTIVLSKKTKDDTIRILGNLGNGFNIKNSSKVIIVGGGIGTPPLLKLAKDILEVNSSSNIDVYLGFRTGQNVILKEEFEKLGCKVYISTDDGSYGYNGNILSCLKDNYTESNIIYSCGPKILLKNLDLFAQENNIECQISMEERMACGFGACVGCVVKIRDKDNTIIKKVCKDGPVFNSSEVIFE